MASSIAAAPSGNRRLLSRATSPGPAAVRHACARKYGAGPARGLGVGRVGLVPSRRLRAAAQARLPRLDGPGAAHPTSPPAAERAVGRRGRDPRQATPPRCAVPERGRPLGAWGAPGRARSAPPPPPPCGAPMTAPLAPRPRPRPLWPPPSAAWEQCRPRDSGGGAAVRPHVHQFCPLTRSTSFPHHTTPLILIQRNQHRRRNQYRRRRRR